MPKTFGSFALGALAVVSCAATDLGASPAGELDVAFGLSGRTFAPCPSGGLRTQPDGKILGFNNFAFHPACVARYLADGSLDPTFGGDGIVDAELGSVLVRDFVLEPAGSMLVAVADLMTSGVLEIVRLLDDGTPDAGFGSGGILATALNSPFAMGQQADGKIIVIGREVSFAGPLVVRRFLADGTVDASFGVAGEVSLAGMFPSTLSGYEVTVAIQNDDGILVGAFEGIARLLPDGTLDSSFGTGGVATVTLYSLPAIAFQSDGRIIATGVEPVRLDTTGAIDPTFSSGGLLGEELFELQGLLVQPDDRIVAAGRIGQLIGAQVGLIRYLPDGGVDETFGDAGRVQLPMTANSPEGGAQLMGTTRLPDGRIAASNDPGGTLTLAYGGTCGDGVTDSGEDCDDGNVTPGDGCDPSCCVSDLDADGRCDSVDPCTAPVVMQKARLKVKGDINIRQAQPIIIKGQAVLPFPFSPALDPPATGVRLLVRNATRRVVDAVIPPGPGWIVSGRRWRWDGTVFPGIERVIVTNVPSAPGTIRVLIRGHGPFFYMGLKDLPLSFEVGMNAALAAPGQCGQATFPGPAPLPNCVQKGDIQLSCR